MAVTWNDQLFSELSARQEGGATWGELAKEIGVSRGVLRGKVRRWRARRPQLPEKPDGEQLEIEHTTNQITASSKSPRIKTLDQLLEACEADLDVWTVDHHILNKWEVGAKDDEGRIVVEPLFQVKAWMVRQEPIPMFPIVQPIEIETTFSIPAPSPTPGPRRTLIFADPHFGFHKDHRNGKLDPFHSRSALDVICQIAQYVQPDSIEVLGDLLDLPDWSDRFLKSPELKLCTQPAVLEGHWWLARLRRLCPNALIRAYEGNHDKRMPDAMIKHLEAAYELRAADEINLPPALSVPKLLALHQLGIEWIGDYPRGRVWLNDSLGLEHGDIVNQNPGDTAKNVARKNDTSTIVAHVHRQEIATRTRHTANGTEYIIGGCVACSCRIDGSVPGCNGRQQWQNGCYVLDYDDSGAPPAITSIWIADGHAIYDQHHFTAREQCTADLWASYPDWNW